MLARRKGIRVVFLIFDPREVGPPVGAGGDDLAVEDGVGRDLGEFGRRAGHAPAAPALGFVVVAGAEGGAPGGVASRHTRRPPPARSLRTAPFSSTLVHRADLRMD